MTSPPVLRVVSRPRAGFVGHRPRQLLLLGAALLAACGQDVSRNSAAGTAAAADASLARPGDASHTANDVSKDLRITTEVKTSLANDSELGALEIQVETRQGHVLLRGITPDTDTRRHAGDLARTVAGVVDVKNDLSVQVRHP